MTRSLALVLALAGCLHPYHPAPPDSVRACEVNGEGRACLEAGLYWEQERDDTRAAAAYWKSCAQHNIQGCHEGYQYDTEANGFQFATTACQLGDDDSCFRRAQYELDPVKKTSILDEVCTRHVESCETAAKVAGAYDADAASRMRSRACGGCDPNSPLYDGALWKANQQRACDGGNGAACFELSESGSPDERRVVLAKACELKYAPACERVAEDAAKQARTDALERAKAACQQGDGDACFSLRSTGTTDEQVEALTRGCKVHHAGACEELGRRRAAK